MAKVVNFKQLKIWTKSMDLVELVYKINNKLPKNERYILGSQILRAAISIPSNIAEGFGRTFKKEKKQFLSIAFSSSLELETQLFIIKRVYPEVNVKQSLNLLDEVQKMLNSYIMQINTE